MAKRDLIGDKFGRLIVIRFDKVVKGNYRWICKCECGNFKSVSYTSLTFGRSRSCGCLAQETRLKHGHSKSRLYSVWTNMKTRCLNPNDDYYEGYGGRGIRVCNEWMQDFSSFYEWANKNGYEEDLTIDRVNNDGHYEPNNCRWVKLDVQMNNKRNNVRITIDGETLTMAEWSKKTGINYKTLHTRFSRGDRGRRLVRGGCS